MRFFHAFHKKNSSPAASILNGSFIFEIVKTVVIATAIVLVVRYFLIQPFYVKGASMEPNFYDQEYLVIDEISYRLSTPVRGDVVVIHYPRDRSQFFIKRLIGLPGETVDIRNDEVMITTAQGDIILHEPYLSNDARTTGTYRATLASDEYFVMGDNRTASLDSRVFGPVNESDIVGRAWVRVWPFARFTFFQRQTYNIELAP
ncbi:MAG: signal peptidase I [Candidatus Kerfeldbacteria bacterium RIFCSPLOWO2_01_FULL_48_11]|uniref:Signal peptidase I n=1 Tax=Candidatus Kerfeldbacteria bacterium RIFCSPLOWO2_01_FULL_48_11 TaxID=1798543 RepID=A0A1G2B4A3_9BACT|nr:MAG: Signal peptidase I [Parcubacteria group bacterium GW2011_GWA2_48_9]KKW14633.1 MAG: Signal peptidase I [Parcubacteria group bacterium GW2011_GWC2_49_9]OGY83040.1 MAG: signal peptidase I [Candidatus Kerfeldbacteria bacterium RIFCSPLOWO2_01_FULL_48_11]